MPIVSVFEFPGEDIAKYHKVFEARGPAGFTWWCWLRALRATHANAAPSGGRIGGHLVDGGWKGLRR
jgi:hypothetical protein